MTTSSDWAAGEAARQLRSALEDLIELHDITVGRAGWVQLRGRLLVPADKAYALAAGRLRPLGYTPLFRRVGQEDVVQALPYALRSTPSRNWIPALFLALTALSMFYVGTLYEGWDLFRGLPPNPLIGLPFAASMLAILGAHEMGHYLVSRHYGVPVSLPYFIPMPLSYFGTMGAVVRLKAPPVNRRVLLAIGASGPLAGLAVAVPLLIVGLRLSDLGPQILHNVVIEGNSLLYAAAKLLVFGRFLPGGGLDVYLHPVAFAAWGGLLVTALNLMPAGQLDGGHIAYALIGERTRYLTLAVIAGLALLGIFFWHGWLIWVALVVAFGWTFATPFNDITRLDGKRIALALLMLVILALIFTPIPMIEL